MTESYVKGIIGKININYMMIRRYSNHISIIYPLDILKVYNDELILTRILPDGSISINTAYPSHITHINDIITEDNTRYNALKG